jgi:hypothetical protein
MPPEIVERDQLGRPLCGDAAADAAQRADAARLVGLLNDRPAVLARVLQPRGQPAPQPQPGTLARLANIVTRACSRLVGAERKIADLERRVVQLEADPGERRALASELREVVLQARAARSDAALAKAIGGLDAIVAHLNRPKTLLRDSEGRVTGLT